MIDMHNHVLYGVDDGAQTVEDSIEMLSKAKEVGFSGVVLTPHYMCYQNFTSSVEENKKRCAVLQEILRRANIDLTLYLGSELLYEYRLVDLVDQGQFTTLGDTDWFLIETIRHGGTSEGVQNFIQKLKQKGYKAIFAHPERYDFVQDDPNILLEFMKNGVLIQCNYLGLIDYYGEPSRKTLEIMLRHNMVQLMGSDAHQVEGYGRYAEAKKAGISLVGEENWQKIMCRNPELLIKNQGGIAVNPKIYSQETKKTVIGNPAV